MRNRIEDYNHCVQSLSVTVMHPPGQQPSPLTQDSIGAFTQNDVLCPAFLHESIVHATLSLQSVLAVQAEPPTVTTAPVSPP